MQSVHVQLSNEPLWREMYPTMEMMCRNTKVLCPELAFEFTGLDEFQQYKVILSFERLDDIRYAFSNNEWCETKCRKVAPKEAVKFLEHSDGYKSGAAWMSEKTRFPKVRVTNRKTHEQETEQNVFALYTMHKYLPVVTLLAASGESLRFRFEIAQFVPVTDYLSGRLREWKVLQNKFTTIRNGGKGKRRATAAADSEPPARRAPLRPVQPVQPVQTPVQYPVHQYVQPMPFVQYPMQNFVQYPVHYSPQPSVSPCSSDFSTPPSDFSTSPSTFYHYPDYPVQFYPLY